MNRHSGGKDRIACLDTFGNSFNPLFPFSRRLLLG
jgi:hypothetical protein